LRYYCPNCWEDFPRDFEKCPNCGLDVKSFFARKDFVEKLIVALGHHEATAPQRAAWILGQLKEHRAVVPLIKVVQECEDIYTVCEAVKALLNIATPEAIDFVKTLTDHKSVEVRRLASTEITVAKTNKDVIVTSKF